MSTTDHPPAQARRTQPTVDILAYLLVAHTRDTPVHGYAIAKATGNNRQSVYQALARLTQAGLCTAFSEAPSEDANRPPRRFFRLTSVGVRYAQRFLKTTERLKSTKWRHGMTSQTKNAHIVTVDGQDYEFDTTFTSSGAYLVEAPGVVQFYADSPRAAADVLRSVYAKEVQEAP